MGSTITYSENIRLELIKFIKENSIKKMLDTSCGDWNWMKLIQNDLCDYTGIDIVDEIIENNKQKFSNEKTHFIQGDLLTYIKSLPDKYYNLILCRHTLEHLPTNYNIDFLIECKRVSNYLLVTGYNNIDRINTDLVDDMRYRPINMELLPYSKILSQYYIKKIYDGPLNDYKEELYIYLYNFS
jgi:ubiquinone/menaquinone biosynthesis C-methylase UbiE